MPRSPELIIHGGQEIPSACFSLASVDTVEAEEPEPEASGSTLDVDNSTLPPHQVGQAAFIARNMSVSFCGHFQLSASVFWGAKTRFCKATVCGDRPCCGAHFQQLQLSGKNLDTFLSMHSSWH